MTLAPMFCTQPFMTTIYLGNVFFFSVQLFSYEMSKGTEAMRDSLSAMAKFQMFSCILSILTLGTCQDTVLSMQRLC